MNINCFGIINNFFNHLDLNFGAQHNYYQNSAEQSLCDNKVINDAEQNCTNIEMHVHIRE